MAAHGETLINICNKTHQNTSKTWKLWRPPAFWQGTSHSITSSFWSGLSLVLKSGPYKKHGFTLPRTGKFTRNHRNSLLPLVDKYGQMVGETSMNGFMVGKWWLNSCNLQTAKLSIIPLYLDIYLAGETNRFSSTLTPAFLTKINHQETQGGILKSRANPTKHPCSCSIHVVAAGGRTGPRSCWGARWSGLEVDPIWTLIKKV